MRAKVMFPKKGQISSKEITVFFLPLAGKFTSCPLSAGNVFPFFFFHELEQRGLASQTGRGRRPRPRRRLLPFGLHSRPIAQVSDERERQKATLSFFRFTYEARHLKAGGKYEAVVQARNKFGWSQRSDVFVFSTDLKGELRLLNGPF